MEDDKAEEEVRWEGVKHDDWDIEKGLGNGGVHRAGGRVGAEALGPLVSSEATLYRGSRLKHQLEETKEGDQKGIIRQKSEK